MTIPSQEGARGEGTHAGYIALAGRPNVGKSTLLNAFMGEKLSIVTPKAQTTRERVLGIVTTERAQMVFVDTPGLLEPRYLLQASMLAAARQAVAEADVVLLLLDAAAGADSRLEGEALGLFARRSGALRVAINKVDAAPGGAAPLEAWVRDALGVEARRISALHGEGVAALRHELERALPESPFFYPEDEIAVQPVRFFVAEMVRETILEEYEQEVPYGTAVVIDEFREAEDPVYIRATVVVERESQKGILIGRGGAAIKRLGARARGKIEAFLDARVYLDLWVKVRPGWRRKKAMLKELGYVPPESE